MLGIALLAVPHCVSRAAVYDNKQTNQTTVCLQVHASLVMNARLKLAPQFSNNWAPILGIRVPNLQIGTSRF